MLLVKKCLLKRHVVGQKPSFVLSQLGTCQAKTGLVAKICCGHMAHIASMVTQLQMPQLYLDT